MLTLTYTPASGPAVIVAVKGPEFGSDEQRARQQVVGETLGGQVYIYEVGVTRHEVHVQLVNLSATERAALEQFIDPTNGVNYARRWFTIDLPPVAAVLLRAGATVGGVTVKAATGSYKAGQRVVQDLIRYYVRLITPSLTFAEPLDGYYSTTFSLRVLSGTRPAQP